MPKMPDFLLQASKEKGLEQDSPDSRRSDEKEKLNNLYSSVDDALREVSLRNKALTGAALSHQHASQVFIDKTNHLSKLMPNPISGPSTMGMPDTQPMPMPPPGGNLDPSSGFGVTNTPNDVNPSGPGVPGDRFPDASGREGHYSVDDQVFPVTNPQLNQLNPPMPIPNAGPTRMEDSPGGLNDPNSPKNMSNMSPQGDDRQEVMALSQASGIPPQQIAALALLGQQIDKIQSEKAQNPMPQPLTGM